MDIKIVLSTKASCFVDHCAEVVMNTIHQLCSLRDPQATSGAASFAASQDVHVQVIYERLAKLLSILVTIDGIILGHDSLRGMCLFSFFGSTLGGNHKLR